MRQKSIATATPQSRRLRDYSNIPFEIFIAVFSVLPFFVLAYFYPILPERVPLFLNLNGEVATRAQKSVLSVFRVPLMALFVSKYIFNFANKWVYVFIASIIAYPLLVFSPA